MGFASFLRSVTLTTTMTSMAALTTSAAHADSRVGSGGYGIIIDGNTYSLDLAIRGVHIDPYLSNNTQITLDAALTDIVDYHLEHITTPSARNIVKRKLSELDQRLRQINFNYRVDGLIQSMDRYRWMSLPDLACLDVRDDQQPFPNKVQLAYRKDMWIRFCQDAERLDEANLAALALHEMIYGFHTEATTIVPQLVGFLFSPEFQSFGPNSRRELETIMTALTNQTGGPATIFARLKAIHSTGNVPRSSNFTDPEVWAGECVEARNPDVLLSSAFATFFINEPVLGSSVYLVPDISHSATDNSYRTPSSADIEHFYQNALSEKLSGAAGMVRQLDFSWTYRGKLGTCCDATDVHTFTLRASVTTLGEPMFVALDESSSGSNRACYFNRRYSIQ